MQVTFLNPFLKCPDRKIYELLPRFQMYYSQDVYRIFRWIFVELKIWSFSKTASKFTWTVSLLDTHSSNVNFVFMEDVDPLWWFDIELNTVLLFKNLATQRFIRARRLNSFSSEKSVLSLLHFWDPSLKSIYGFRRLLAHREQQLVNSYQPDSLILSEMAQLLWRSKLIVVFSVNFVEA